MHLADLGLKTLRYPMVWERTAPHHPDDLDWRWSDERLTLLKQQGIRPILGLVHHGSGPGYASFDTPAFEEGLARFARHVAERYPWVEDYTPVNEPLTTARFAGLYGHWYPHTRSDQSFAQILLRECRATIKAMQEIRKVQPAARLIQTDDLGYTHAAAPLTYQADWENERRWLTWDLLCGRITPGHAMWDYLRSCGITKSELCYFIENACPPSVIGVNHYLTSERFLDPNIRNYPEHMHGGNGRHRYVDTEVVRAAPDQRIGVGGLLLQAWERYHLPLAITEAHLGCTVDEQIRWLMEVWEQVHEARTMGADVRAMTVWALLGSYDWHCLVTRCEGYYEPGAFDVRSGTPVRTPLGDVVQRLALGEPVGSLRPEGPGWWEFVPQSEVA